MNTPWQRAVSVQSGREGRGTIPSPSLRGCCRCGGDGDDQQHHAFRPTLCYLQHIPSFINCIVITQLTVSTPLCIRPRRLHVSSRSSPPQDPQSVSHTAHNSHPARVALLSTGFPIAEHPILTNNSTYHPQDVLLLHPQDDESCRDLQNRRPRGPNLQD